VSGDAATVALDEADAERLAPKEAYRLVTLPTEPQADREFASLLRTADETMAAVTAEAGSDLVGSTVGEAGVVVAAVRPDGGSVQPIPPRGYVFGARDLVYLVGRPDAIRRFEAAAVSHDPAEASETGGRDGTGGQGETGGRDGTGRSSGRGVASAEDDAADVETDDGDPPAGRPVDSEESGEATDGTQRS